MRDFEWKKFVNMYEEAMISRAYVAGTKKSHQNNQAPSVNAQLKYIIRR